jgi:TonB family protein
MNSIVRSVSARSWSASSASSTCASSTLASSTSASSTLASSTSASSSMSPASSTFASIAFAVSALAMSGCASTAGVLDRESAPRTGVQLSLVPAIDAVRIIPAAIDPQLPRVDHMARRIKFELGDRVSAELSLCVSPQGSVTDVAIARSSGMSDLDTAIVDDVRAWQFAEMPGPSSVRTCRQATLAYRVR